MAADPADPPEDAPKGERAVLTYLAALETGRSATHNLPHPDVAPESLASADQVGGDEQDEIETDLAESTPGSEANVRTLEDGFVQAAAAYGERHGMTYESWRIAGVDPEVLARAGIEPAPE